MEQVRQDPPEMTDKGSCGKWSLNALYIFDK